MLKRALALSVAAGMALAAFVILAAGGKVDSRGDTNVFTRNERAPSEPPTVIVEGKEIAPSYYEWGVNGENITFKASADQDDADLTYISSDSGGTLLVALSSSVRPADFRVVFFDDVDENGVPTAGHGVEIDCLRDDACTLRRKNGELTARVPVTLHPRVMVVHLLYADVIGSGDRTQVDHLVGSWGVRFTDKDET